jgi:hypothetical protein
VAFDMLFGAGGTPEARKARLETRRSILDWINGEVKSVRSQLGPADRIRLDRYVDQVGEIERVSRELDSALSTILSAAERTRTAASGVTTAAMENARAVDSAAVNLGLVARTAEGHATAAMEVSASTEEQSAACEQMSMASTQLFHGSHVLLDLVSELKTGVPTAPVEPDAPAVAKSQPAADSDSAPRPIPTPPHPSPRIKRVA